MEQWLEDFKQTIDSAFPRLLRISEAQSEAPRAEEHWSSKQIIGHLIDSAANNHARFVLAQFKDDLVFPGYDQNKWVQAQQYESASWPRLVELWRAYNLHLLHVMSSASKEKLSQVRTEHSLQTIAFKTLDHVAPTTPEHLIQDHVGHPKH